MCEKIAPPVPARRRASELPPTSSVVQQAAVKPTAHSSGIVCTNTDLLSIMNSLKSTANRALSSEYAAGRRPGASKTTDSLPAAAATSGGPGDGRRDALRSGRSNSVDVANLGATAAAGSSNGTACRNWFRKLSTRAAAAQLVTAGPRTGDAECCGGGGGGSEQLRPVTIGGGGEYVVQKSPVVVTFADERPKVSLLLEAAVPCGKPEKQSPVGGPLSPRPVSQPRVANPQPEKPGSSSAAADVVVWDRPTGSVVNAKVLGTAIEGFLAAKKSDDGGSGGAPDARSPSDDEPGGKPSDAANEPNAGRTCDTSICSSLKDLFVK